MRIFSRGDAAGHDLLPHGFAERHHQVGGQHALGLGVPVPLVELTGHQLGAVRVAGQPGVLPEPAHLVHHGQAEPFAQGEGEPGVGEVARRVQHRGPDPARQLGGELQVHAGGLPGGVGAGGHEPRQQAVIGHAVQHDQAAPIEPALGHRVSAPGNHVRIEPGGPLSDRDLVRPDRVPGAGSGQGVGDQVQHASRHPLLAPSRTAPAAQFMIMCRNGRYLAKTAHDHGRAGLLGGESGAQAAGWAGACCFECLEGLGELALFPGQARGQCGAGPVVFWQPGQGGRGGVWLIHGQGERGQAPGRGGQGRERRVPLPRSPQHGRPAVWSGAHEHCAQRGGQYPPGQQQRPDRVASRMPPADRGGEREGARRKARSARNGRHGGGW